MSTKIDYSLVHPVPGLGKPIDYIPDDQHDDPLWVGNSFPNPLSNDSKYNMPLTTLREFNMMRFMNAITDKENWQIKIMDDSIAEKWKDEAIAEARRIWLESDTWDSVFSLEDHSYYPEPDPSEGYPDESEPFPFSRSYSVEVSLYHELREFQFSLARRDGSGMTELMAAYCIDELRYKARHLHESPHGAIIVYNGNVVKSDVAIPFCIKTALQSAAARLEDVPDGLKDWHPGSNGKVLDLVHPSLFPLVHGKTKVLQPGANATTLADCVQRCGEGQIQASSAADLPCVYIQYPGHYATVKESFMPYSNDFQWLPCEVDVTGDKARITSYINNLHPQRHKELYAVIEDVITAAIPLWELTLAPLANGELKFFQRVQYTNVLYDPDPRTFPSSESPRDWLLRDTWYDQAGRFYSPEPEGPFNPANLVQSKFDLKDRFAELGRPLQVIVKLANIELTPENPKYEGGTWHLEGKLNEHIVATAIYYYSSSNITQSSLAFRQVSDANMSWQTLNYQQNEHGWLNLVYGCENFEGAVQDIGSVDTREGRLITFPNILQHQVQPFELEDKTKPGHRKILALFLVDPHVRTISTASVPCQQFDWWREEVETPQNDAGSGWMLPDLPLELRDQIFEKVEDFPIRLEDAKGTREGLMAERKDYVRKSDVKYRSLERFCLCEH
ncbi:hypothetical protein FA15DRAFT_605121 [Coprinopsis marcescibilis]|uniref:Uncharacterized protein n=1 Tax=Coprinopsis marcescibilis TaxID=230819 RepID=A0A5C3KBV8_COPMA|nr:hypothetical protein FA15DRAFT_605121 [Coprinopsis marcescibilis]